MRYLWLTFFMLFPLVSGAAEETEELHYVVIAEPYIEMHTGPGAAYPVTHVVERGEEIGIIKRRTDWFKVRSPRGVEGWVFADQLSLTLQPSGAPVVVPVSTFEEFQASRWEAGVLAGDFDDATSLSIYGGYRLSRHLTTEAEYTEIFADNSEGWVASINIRHTFVPEWRVSPFFLLGTGMIHLEPKESLVDTDDQDDQVAIVGAGFRAYLTRKLLFRAEYKGYVVLDSDDDNEDVDEWKAGFAIFF